MPILFDLNDYQRIQQYLELPPQSLYRLGTLANSNYQIYNCRNAIDLKYYGEQLEQLDVSLRIEDDIDRSYVQKVKNILAEIDALDPDIKTSQLNIASTFEELEVKEEYRWQRPDNKNAWDGALVVREDLIKKLANALGINRRVYNGCLTRSF